MRKWILSIVLLICLSGCVTLDALWDTAKADPNGPPPIIDHNQVAVEMAAVQGVGETAKIVGMATGNAALIGIGTLITVIGGAIAVAVKKK